MQRGYIRFNNDTKTVGGTTTPLTSADFGVYLSGTGTYNAPSRDVSYIAIPGRSQDIVHDNGRFNNVTITYPCFIYSNSQSDFDSKLADFRAYVKKFVGWVRLTDSYHPNEYRMVNADAEISVDVIPDHRAGEFQLSLTAQPYRYLTSGETFDLINVEVQISETETFTIENNTYYATEGDYYFVSINGGGQIIIDNDIGTITATIPSKSGISCYKFDAGTGIWLEPSAYDSQKSYKDQTYDTVSTAISMVITYKTSAVSYLPTVLAPGNNDVTVSCTAVTQTGGSVMFYGYYSHWRTI